LGLPFAEKHGDTCLSIPCHPQLTDGEVSTVIQALNDFR
jgi:dTDP-4-amino-4,6-dideoxygalactose transaminase